jgi:hypothetical protein
MWKYLFFLLYKCLNFCTKKFVYSIWQTTTIHYLTKVSRLSTIRAKVQDIVLFRLCLVFYEPAPELPILLLSLLKTVSLYLQTCFDIIGEKPWGRFN